MDNGYVEMSNKVTVGDIQLEISDLWESPQENMDLSMIIERPDSRESELRLYWLVQRLARALDSASSRRTVTVILIGEPSQNSGLSELLELARVLVVDGSLATERMIGPLLRLRLPVTATSQLDGIADVVIAIGKNQSTRDLMRIIHAAEAGAGAVTDRYRVWLEESFLNKGSSDV
ncbi:hypothetical protein GCM10007173_35390 [Glutamicibacter ardleyensis]|uniref:Uncharacterized protein n=2 Tax=Glutamicibacter ardleyensis TaxID=225894 RepID=A0ABQ2DUH4_9MICC|nr:hypothetical protein GCM10007173_35390 [Glutamicibacter ardleyensis]